MGVAALSRTGAVVTTKFEDRLPVFDSALPVYPSFRRLTESADANPGVNVTQLSSASLIRHRNKLECSSVASSRF